MSERKLPAFYSDEYKITEVLQEIIYDLYQENTSLICPCKDCHECNSFFTQMKKSSMCPCTALKQGLVNKEDLISHLEEAIVRIKQDKEE